MFGKSRYVERSIEPSFNRLQSVLGNIKLNSISVRELDKFISFTYANSPGAAKERIIPLNDKLYSLLKSYFPKIISINNTDFFFHRHTGIKLNSDFL